MIFARGREGGCRGRHVAQCGCQTLRGGRSERWVKRFETTGEIAPAPTGGDQRSKRIETHRDYLLGLIRRTPDITLLEIEHRLLENCGERFSSSVLWRFFNRHDITFKNVWPAPSASSFFDSAV